MGERDEGRCQKAEKKGIIKQRGKESGKEERDGSTKGGTHKWAGIRRSGEGGWERKKGSGE